MFCVPPLLYLVQCSNEVGFFDGGYTLLWGSCNVYYTKTPYMVFEDYAVMGPQLRLDIPHALLDLDDRHRAGVMAGLRLFTSVFFFAVWLFRSMHANIYS